MPNTDFNTPVFVDYQLNKELALAKKVAACERVEYKVTQETSCCVIELNTVSFEYFKLDISELILESSCYTQKSDNPVKDLDRNIAQDIRRIVSSETGKHLFTINLYRTSSRVMVNGSEYKKFVNDDLPKLLKKLDARKDQLYEENKMMKGMLSEAMSSKKASTDKGKSDSKDEKGSKRIRKTKTYDDFETTPTNKRSTRLSVKSEQASMDQASSSTSKVLSYANKTDQAPEDKEQANNWEEEPKFWKVYGKGAWSKSVADVCNRSRGCIVECGGYNTKEMIRCDGCGGWIHFKCLDVKVINKDDDYVCLNCLGERNSKVEDMKDKLDEKTIAKKEKSTILDIPDSGDEHRCNIEAHQNVDNKESEVEPEMVPVKGHDETLTCPEQNLQDHHKGTGEIKEHQLTTDMKTIKPVSSESLLETNESLNTQEEEDRGKNESRPLDIDFEKNNNEKGKKGNKVREEMDQCSSQTQGSKYQNAQKKDKLPEDKDTIKKIDLTENMDTRKDTTQQQQLINQQAALIDQLIIQTGSLTNRNKDLESQLMESKQQTKLIEEHLQQAQNLQTKCSCLEGNLPNNRKGKPDIEKNKDDSQNSSKNIVMETEELERVKKLLEEKEKENLTIKGELKKKDSTIKSLSSEIKEFEKQVKKLKENLKESTEANDALMQHNKELERENMEKRSKEIPVEDYAARESISVIEKDESDPNDNKEKDSPTKESLKVDVFLTPRDTGANSSVGQKGQSLIHEEKDSKVRAPSYGAQADHTYATTKGKAESTIDNETPSRERQSIPTVVTNRTDNNKEKNKQDRREEEERPGKEGKQSGPGGWEIVKMMAIKNTATENDQKIPSIVNGKINKTRDSKVEEKSNPAERKRRCFGCGSELHAIKDCPRENNLLIKFRYAEDCSIQEIYREFAKYGEIKRVTIKKPNEGEISNEAFLCFETAGEAAKVLQAQENKSR